MITYTDKNGNVLSKDFQELYVHLKRINERRRVGVLDRGTLLVERRPYWEAKREGHWLYKHDAWGLNYDAMRHSRTLGFWDVYLIGFDGQNQEHRIRRKVSDILRWGYVLWYPEKGFEVQITFHVKPGRRVRPDTSGQGELF